MEEQKEINYCPSEEVNKLKAQYGTIYSVVIGDQEYIFKPITRKEMQNIVVSVVDAFERENKMVECCVLYPKLNVVTAAALPAGVISTLADQISYYSGFGQPVEVKKL